MDRLKIKHRYVILVLFIAMIVLCSVTFVFGALQSGLTEGIVDPDLKSNALSDDTIMGTVLRGLGKTVLWVLDVVFGIISYFLFSLITALATVTEKLLGFGFDFEAIFGLEPETLQLPVTLISAIIIVLLLTFDIAKNMSGLEDRKKVTMPEYLAKLLLAYGCLIMLPIVIQVFETATNYFVMYLNNLMITQLMVKFSISVDSSSETLVEALQNSDAFSQAFNDMANIKDTLSDITAHSASAIARPIVLLLFFIVFLAGVLAVAISAAKKYIELLLAIIFVPFISMSVVFNLDRLMAYLSKLAKIFIGYMLNIFFFYMLYYLSMDMLTCEPGIMPVKLMVAVAIVISVITGGTNMLQEYITPSSTGSQLMRGASSAMIYGPKIKR